MLIYQQAKRLRIAEYPDPQEGFNEDPKSTQPCFKTKEVEKITFRVHLTKMTNNVSLRRFGPILKNTEFSGLEPELYDR